MPPTDDEERRLRAVALHNAQSILIARQRAEEELVRAKEALERKTHELAQAVAMLRATLESTTDGILVTDRTGKVTGFNEQYLAMWGLPRSLVEAGDHRGLRETKARHLRQPQQFLDRTEAIYAESPPETFDLLEFTDGRVFERFSRLQVIEQQNVGRVWSFRDITQQRRAEEALRKQAEWWQVTLASIGDAVITTDTEGRVLSLNGVAQTLTGWTQAEAQGRPLREVFRIINEDNRQPVANPAEQVLRQGHIVGLANHTILIARDGTETPIDDSAAPIRDDHGRVLGVVLVFRDITERRQAEDALRRSERELADFFENASVGLHWVGPDGTILRANRAELEMLGYALEEYVGHDIAEFHVDADVIADILRRLTAGEILRDYEARLRCKDGSIKHVLIDSSVRWLDGQFLHTRCFTRDITDRKRGEEVQARLAAIVESSEDAIISKTLETRITSWNAAAERLFGYTAAEAIGQSILLLIPPERQDEELMILERLRRGERIEHFETVRVGKDGRRMDVSLTISPVRDSSGRVVGASKIARDITARKQAEQALRRSEAQFRFLADASAALAELADERSTLQRIAGLAVPLFADWCAVDLLSDDGNLERVAIQHADPAKVRHVREIARRYPSRLDDRDGISEALRTGKPQLVEQVADELLVSLAHDDEHLRQLRELSLRSYVCVPLLSRGKNLGVLTFVMAESGRRYDAADLRAAQDLGQRAVVAIENARLYRALQEADRRKDEFLATLAHELRNPLAPIRNGVRILEKANGNWELVDSARQMMGRQVQHMIRLVDDLLDMSRISRGKIELRKEKVELATVLHNAVETSRPLIEAAGHELEVALPATRVWLEADPVRLAQVVANLLNNAAKYTREGGHIWLTAEQEADEAVIRVRDNGIGITAEMLPRIFEMFAQVDSSVGRSQGGLGIGLTLVQRLVEMHRGTVEGRSEGPGKGSEFIVRLPVVVEKLGIAAQKKRAAGGGSLHARRILVVDDNIDAAQSLCLLMKLMGHDTAMAQDGLIALEAVQAYQPHIVLLDIGLPGLNGYEVARRIRQQPGLQDVVLVALTGWGQEEDRRRCQEAGFDHHLAKPADPAAIEKLLAALRAVGPGEPRP